jgi:hypothetical protein
MNEATSLAFFSPFPPKTQFAGWFKTQTHCFALEGALLDRPHV